MEGTLDLAKSKVFLIPRYDSILGMLPRRWSNFLAIRCPHFFYTLHRRRKSPAGLAHSPSRDQKSTRRFYVCAGVARGRVEDLKRMNANGSDDILLSDKKDISPIVALALPSAGLMAVCIEARLSAFTIILKLIEGSSNVP